MRSQKISTGPDTDNELGDGQVVLRLRRFQSCDANNSKRRSVGSPAANIEQLAFSSPLGIRLYAGLQGWKANRKKLAGGTGSKLAVDS